MDQLAFKKSKYNYICNNHQGDMLIYNTLNGTFTKILSKDAEKYASLKSGPLNIQSDALQKSGIILPNDADEEALYNALQHQILNENILTIVIVLTTKCNFRCTYCFESEYESCAMNLDYDHAKAITNFVRKKIHKYRGLSVAWFGGEPLLNMEYIRKLSQDFINICSCAKKEYSAVISTNGYLLTKEIFRELLQFQVKEYQITIDGLEQTHNALRPLAGGKGTFKRITENLEALKKVKGNFRVSIRTNCNSDVLENLNEYISYIDNLLYQDPRFKVYFSPVYDAGGSFSSDLRETLLNTDEVDLAVRAFNLLTHKSVFDEVWVTTRLSRNLLCGASLTGNYVFTEKGQVCKCSTHYQDDEICHVGQIIDGQAVIDKYKEAKWLYNLSAQKEDCYNCVLKPICYPNLCPYHLIKDEENPKSWCGSKKDKLLKFSELLKVMDHLNAFHVIV